MRAERVRLGMVRLTDAAPLVLAESRGLFAAAGLRSTISVEPSWANIADKLAWGLLDGAVMLHPLAIAMAIGLRGPAARLLIPAGISRNGNAVTLAPALAEAVLANGAAGLRRALHGRAKLRLAVVHAFSTHDLLLRRFLESGGIDPDRDVDVSTIPPPEMPEALLAGRIDGFCAGAPWSAVAAQMGAGRTAVLGSAIWPDHAEKCLVVRHAWAEADPAALEALIGTMRVAGEACDDAATTPELAALLSRPEWIGVAAPLIATSLPGGSGTDSDRSVFAARGAMAPTVAEGREFLREIGRRWPVPDDAGATVAALYAPGVERSAADAAMLP